jgi:hypothetical protein
MSPVLLSYAIFCASRSPTPLLSLRSGGASRPGPIRWIRGRAYRSGPVCCQRPSPRAPPERVLKVTGAQMLLSLQPRAPPEAPRPLPGPYAAWLSRPSPGPASATLRAACRSRRVRARGGTGCVRGVCVVRGVGCGRWCGEGHLPHPGGKEAPSRRGPGVRGGCGGGVRRRCRRTCSGSS